jgi:asparagine synthase (glutamine-hydrolysing)
LAGLVGGNSQDLYRQLMSDNADADSLVLGLNRSGRAYPYSLEGLLEGGTAADRAMLADTLTYLPDDILTKVDRASMAVSLEVRVPLLDPELFKWAWALDPALRRHQGQSKWPLREVLRRYVPNEMIDRPKMGFGVPIGAWLRGPLRTWASDLLSPAVISQQGYLDASAVDLLWQGHVSGRSDHSYQLWPILMFQAWLQEWM